MSDSDTDVVVVRDEGGDVVDITVPEFELAESGLPIRTCGRCGKRDDHPRCLPHRPDDPAYNLHQDCHQEMAGPMECHAHIADGSAEGLRGDDLRSFIVTRGN